MKRKTKIAGQGTVQKKNKKKEINWWRGPNLLKNKRKEKLGHSRKENVGVNAKHNTTQNTQKRSLLREGRFAK